MTEFGTNHKRALVNQFKHIDKLFWEIESLLDTGNGRSLFPGYLADVSHGQRERLEAGILAFREAMARILENKGISTEQPLMSTRHAVRVTLHFVDIAIQELSPEHMRGYGAPSKNAALELDEIVTELQSMTREMKNSLSEDDGKGTP